jgi:hypothetical protein
MEGVLVTKLAVELVVGPEIAVGRVIWVTGWVWPDLVICCAGRCVRCTVVEIAGEENMRKGREEGVF